MMQVDTTKCGEGRRRNEVMLFANVTSEFEKHPTMEALDSRLLLSTTVYQGGSGPILITGTNGDDTISIRHAKVSGHLQFNVLVNGDFIEYFDYEPTQIAI